MLGGVTAAEAKSSKSAKYDLVIVGAGCGGLVCAIHAAELGVPQQAVRELPKRRCCPQGAAFRRRQPWKGTGQLSGTGLTQNG